MTNKNKNSKIFLGNAFSLKMLPQGAFAIHSRPVEVDEVRQVLQTCDFVSAVGHADTANVLSHELGAVVLPNRISVSLEEGDVLYVAQLEGPRLPEGATQLPEGASFAFFKITIERE